MGPRGCLVRGKLPLGLSGQRRVEILSGLDLVPGLPDPTRLLAFAASLAGFEGDRRGKEALGEAAPFAKGPEAAAKR